MVSDEMGLQELRHRASGDKTLIEIERVGGGERHTHRDGERERRRGEGCRDQT